MMRSFVLTVLCNGNMIGSDEMLGTYNTNVIKRII